MLTREIMHASVLEDQTAEITMSSYDVVGCFPHKSVKHYVIVVII